PALSGGGMDLGTIGAHRGLIQGCERKLHIRVRAGEGQPSSRPSGGDDGGLSVDEGQSVEGTVECEVLAAMPGGPHPCAVRIVVARTVENERVVIPAAPERSDAREPLLGPVVGFVVAELRVSREVPGAAGVG